MAPLMSPARLGAAAPQPFDRALFAWLRLRQLRLRARPCDSFGGSSGGYMLQSCRGQLRCCVMYRNAVQEWKQGKGAEQEKQAGKGSRGRKQG